VTDRCAREDLGLDSWPDPEGVNGVSHDAVRKFRDRRRSDPEPSNAYINDIKTKPCFRLKDGRLRGCSWFDKDKGVVYLLAVAYREASSRDDAYEDFLALERSGRLFPTREDEEELMVWRAGRWLRQLRDKVGPDLRAKAEGQPGTPFSRDIGHCDCVLVADTYEGGWLYQLRIERHEHAEPLGDRQAAEIAAAVLGNVDVLEESGMWYGRGVPWDCRAFAALRLN